MIKSFPSDPKAAKAQCKEHCPKCCCWVCDDEVSKCPDWDSHCACDGSPEWAALRAKLKRKAEAAKAAADQGRSATDSADTVNARFAHAAQQDVDGGGGGGGGSSSVEQQARQDAREEAHEDEENEELFSDYSPLHLTSGQPHPDPVVETTSLSFAELPRISYALNLPADIFLPRTPERRVGGALSRAQLETVSYACQKHETYLPTGERAGFFLGDGVGLGKGRQLAGMVLDSWRNGRRRHLWVSVSADLAVDATRDLTDIGATDIVVSNITKLPGGVEHLDKAKDGKKDGVIFATYSALSSSSKTRGKKGGKAVTRLEQIVNWLGGAGAEGCILFDESHKAKHLFPESANDADDDGSGGGAGVGGGGTSRGRGRGKSKGGKSTKMAKAVQALQQACPKARVVYCSATGASSLGNMAYMERLGLWGAGTAFPEFGDFDKAISAGGVGAMELVALDMKRRGMYISRQLSFKSASYDTRVIDLTPAQTAMYDAAAHFWMEMHGCFETAMGMLNVKGHPSSFQQTKQLTPVPDGKGGIKYVKAVHPAARVMTHYWGCHQRFFRALCMSVKVPEVVRIAHDALASNKCVVIGLQTTGEARLSDAVKAGHDLEEFAGLRENVRFMLSKFPTGDYLNRYPEADLTDDEDEEEDQEMVDVANRKARERRGRLGKGNGARAAARRMRGDGDDEERSEEEEMDEDMARFIVDGSDDEDEDDEDEDDDEEEGDDEEGDASAGSDMDAEDGEGGSRPRKQRKVSLPDELKKLTSGQLRQVVKAAAAKDNGCMTRAHLLSKLKEVERAHLEGNGPSLDALLHKLGFKKGGNKRGSPSDGGDGGEGSGGPRRRLVRGAAIAARQSYIEIDGSDDDGGEEDGEEEEADCVVEDGAGAGAHGLLHHTIQVKVNGAFKPAVVVGVPGRGARALSKGQVLVRFEGGGGGSGGGGSGSGGNGSGGEGGETMVDLRQVEWRQGKARQAPGAAGSSSQGAAAGAPRRRKKSIGDDDDDDEEGSDGDFENAPPQAGRKGASGRNANGKAPAPLGRGAPRAGRRKSIVESDDESASEWQGSASEEEEEEPERKPAAGRAKAKAGSSKAAAPKRGGGGGRARRKRGGSDDEDDDDEDEDDDDDDARDAGEAKAGEVDPAIWQHADKHQIKQLQRLKRTLLKKLNSLAMPENPLDQLINDLGGAEHVAEMTGRKGRLVRDSNGKTVYAKRNEGEREDGANRDVAMERINLQERKNFMDGKKVRRREGGGGGGPGCRFRWAALRPLGPMTMLPGAFVPCSSAATRLTPTHASFLSSSPHTHTCLVPLPSPPPFPPPPRCCRCSARGDHLGGSEQRHLAPGRPARQEHAPPRARHP